MFSYFILAYSFESPLCEHCLHIHRNNPKCHSHFGLIDEWHHSRVALSDEQSSRVIYLSSHCLVIIRSRKGCARVASFPRYGKHRKIMEIKYKNGKKLKNRRKRHFCDSKKWKSLFLEYFKVKPIAKNLRLVKLLLKFNKYLIVYL